MKSRRILSTRSDVYRTVFTLGGNGAQARQPENGGEWRGESCQRVVNYSERRREWRGARMVMPLAASSKIGQAVSSTPKPSRQSSACFPEADVSGNRERARSKSSSSGAPVAVRPIGINPRASNSSRARHLIIVRHNTE